MTWKFPCTSKIIHTYATLALTLHTIFYLAIVKSSDQAALSQVMMIWMTKSLINFVFYSNKFILSLVSGLVSLLATLISIFIIHDIMILTAGIVLAFWMIMSLVVIEFAKIKLAESSNRFAM